MVVEKKHHASDLAQLDKAIEDQELRLAVCQDEDSLKRHQCQRDGRRHG